MAVLVENLIFATAGKDSSGNPSVKLWRNPDVLELDSQDMKLQGVLPTGRRPVFVWFRGDLYCIGAFTRPLVRHRIDPRWLVAGIKRPPGAITVVPGTGSGGDTGDCLAYITFQHRVGDVVLAESGASNVVELTLTGTGRAWGNLNQPADDRVTHIAGYVSVAGSDFRRAFLAPIGTTTYEENVSRARLSVSGFLGEYIPPAGVYYGATAFGRMFYAANSEHPYRVWYSKTGEPGVRNQADFLDLPDRREITGIAVLKNFVIVFSKDGSYLIREYGGIADFNIEKIDDAIGCVSHWSIKNIHNKLWFAGVDGIWIWDGGGFYSVTKDIRPFWLEDYLANEDDFADSYGVDDQIGKNYILLVPRAERSTFRDETPGTVAYVGSYLNFERSLGGQFPQPDWEIDVRYRRDYVGEYTTLNQVYYGSEDGKLRVEDVDNNDDDGDSIEKRLEIETSHRQFQQPGDDIQSGKNFVQLWAYVQAEWNAWTMYALGGDEWAIEQKTPDNTGAFWKVDVQPSGLPKLSLVGGVFKIAKYIKDTVHYFLPQRVSGRGITLLFKADKPREMRYRGFGGAFHSAPATRKLIEQMDLPLGSDWVTTLEYWDAGLASWEPLDAATIVLGGGPLDLQIRSNLADPFTLPVRIAYIINEQGGPDADADFLYEMLPAGSVSDGVTYQIGPIEYVVTAALIDADGNTSQATANFEVLPF